MRISFAFAGFCMSPKKSVCALRISGGTASAQRPQNLWPMGTTLEHERQTKWGLFHELLLGELTEIERRRLGRRLRRVAAGRGALRLRGERLLPGCD
jgi:hypothetical protein